MTKFADLMYYRIGDNWVGQRRDNSPDWTLVESLFDNHYPNKDRLQNKVPKKIHQIWLGSKIPQKYDRLCKTWRDCHPDWEYKLWTDADIASFGMRNINQFNSTSNFGGKSDILRYEILYRHGGIYADTDFECIKPLDDLLYLDFFTGTGHNEQPIWFNGLIGCTQHNRILESLVNEQKRPIGNNWDGIAHQTGPYYFSEIVTRHLRLDAAMNLVFPTTFFYPVSNAIRDSIREDTQSTREYVYSHLTPESRCAHLWYCGWQ